MPSTIINDDDEIYIGLHFFILFATAKTLRNRNRFVEPFLNLPLTNFMSIPISIQLNEMRWMWIIGKRTAKYQVILMQM